MVTSNNTTCMFHVDNRFGPVVSQSCRGGFDFTLLFEQSVLSIVPSGFFLALFPLRLWQLLCTDRKTVPSLLQKIKIVVTFSLPAIQIAALILWSLPSQPRTRASIAASTLSFLDGGALCILSFVEHERSVHPSHLLNAYLFFTITFDSVQTRTLWLMPRQSGLAALLTASCALKLVVLVLENWPKRTLLRLQYRNTSSEDRAGIFSLLSFWWLNGLLLRGFKKPLAAEDLLPLDSALDSVVLGENLKRAWEKKRTQGKQSLSLALLHGFQGFFLAPVFPRLALTGFTIAQPFFIMSILDFTERKLHDASTESDGYGLIGAASLVYAGIAICNGFYHYHATRTATVVRGGLVCLIYGKILQISPESVEDSATLTLMSSDVDRIQNSLLEVHEIWAAALEVGILTYLLERQVGWTCIAPIILTILAFGGNGWISTILPGRQKFWVTAIQSRVSMTASALSNMKSVMMMGLSDRLSVILQTKRVEEIECSKHYRELMVAVNFFAYLPSMIAPALTFTLAVVSNAHEFGSTQPFTAKAFTALAIIELLTTRLLTLLSVIPAVIGATGCIERIQLYLLKREQHDAENHEPAIRTHDQQLVKIDQEKEIIHETQSRISEAVSLTALVRQAGPAIVLDHCVFAFAPNFPTVLDDISIKVPSGQLTMIIGPVGSGKTALLRAMIGEMHKITGSIDAPIGQTAFCQQSPWLQNRSVRGNIVGTAPFNPEWYKTVLYSCSLDRDILDLPGGDDYMVGSKGARLSGGQRHRVALARAVYSQKPIIIMDDTFSALDGETAEVIFQRLLSSDGLFKTRAVTVVFSTNNERQLQFADHVIVLRERGHIFEQGDYRNLACFAAHNFSTAEAWRSLGHDPDVVAKTTPKEFVSKASNPANNHAINISDLSTYAYYLRPAGWLRVVMMVFLVCACTILSRMQQIWLAWWSEAHAQRAMYIGVYFLLGMGGLVFVALFMLWTAMLVAPRPSSDLHHKLLNAIMHAPLSFFGSVDAGIIVNRFSQDMSLIDTQLPLAIMQTSSVLAMIIAQITLIAIGGRYIGAAIPGCLFAIYVVQKFFLRTSKQLRLLDLEAKSPLYTHFIETIEGLSTIRAFGWQTTFQTMGISFLNHSQKPFYLLPCIQLWLKFVLDMLVTGLAVLLVAIVTALETNPSSAYLGVALLNLLDLSDSLSNLVQSWTTLETSLGAVARTKEIVEQLTPDPLDNKDQSQPQTAQAFDGTLKFENVTAAYSATTAEVLKDVSLTIARGEKVGICGRTGSGKSSLVAAICKLLTLKSGTIYIDGMNICSIPNSSLSSHVFVVPQDAFFSTGTTVRFNVFTTAIYPDTAIIDAFQRVGLWDTISKAGGLDADISFIPLSHGQKQLFRLACALLQDSKIIILDEATSSVDTGTNEMIQEVIGNEFSERTVLTIAHRLDTILHCDKVFVMEGGRIVKSGKMDHFDAKIEVMD